MIMIIANFDNAESKRRIETKKISNERKMLQNGINIYMTSEF
jgi:hypothetical protein